MLAPELVWFADGLFVKLLVVLEVVEMRLLWMLSAEQSV